MAKILLLNGPNLNLLGQREPNVYGSETLDSLCSNLAQQAAHLGHQLDARQSNAEHELIDTIQKTTHDFILFNPAALTHTSIALRDALLAANIPFIEIHISNIYQREPFRYTSFFSDIAIGIITGLGVYGYTLALQAAHHYLENLK